MIKTPAKAIVLCLTICSYFFYGCNNKNGDQDHQAPPVDTQKPQAVAVPAFDADTAYNYVAAQVAYGPRVSGTLAQTACAAWMENKLRQYCDTVYVQKVAVTADNGKQLPCINLVGVIHPRAVHRVLFLTHWDSRPWADEDTVGTDKPILAADDGGSGVAVLLEVVREIKMQGKLPETAGVDILFTDVEDFGRSEWGEDSYCLGTQYWAKHPHVPGYKADYGVLLDMVGAHGALFPMENFSTQYAPDVQQIVWQAASDAGYSSYFPYVAAADITDDHLPVNRIAGIKTIDVINLTTDLGKPFAAHWHTHADNMSIIDKGTLKAVGQTMLQVIYSEKRPGS